MGDYGTNNSVATYAAVESLLGTIRDLVTEVRKGVTAGDSHGDNLCYYVWIIIFFC